MKNINTLLKVVKSEGLAAALSHAGDSLTERQRLRRYTRISAHDLRHSQYFRKPPVINLSVLPPYPKRGGSQLQMLDRLLIEQLKRSTAVLYPSSNRWRLEVTSEGHAWILEGPVCHPSDIGLLHAVRWARQTLTTDAVHIENLAGLPLDLVPTLVEGGRIMIAVHDFTGYCRRPHLIEEPHSIFCNYSSDKKRCSACLAYDWQLPPNAAKAHRDLAGQALMAADHIVFPSEFLKRQYIRLFAGHDLASRSRVIAPATKTRFTIKDRHPHPPHIAFVGGIKSHKGGALVIETATHLHEHSKNLRLTSFGDGDPALLRELKSSDRVRVRGYYRSGELPGLLLRNGVDIAIFPSIWPESYGLVVDECLRARIPVIAFDHGAVGPRLTRLEVGRVVAPQHGAKGLAKAAIQLLDSEVSPITDAVLEDLPTTLKVAEQYLELYREIAKS